jgi:hypothetical protein
MSGLLFLSSEDFHIVNGQKSNIMCHKIPGLSLIFFYANPSQCQHCKTLIPIFRKLPGTIGGCQFGMLNVSSNKSCVRMSKGTRSEIKYVPLIILYVNGKPSTIYNGPHDQQEITRFVFEMSKQLNSRQQFTDKNNQQTNQQVSTKSDELPVYGGHPLRGFTDINYLIMDNAYGKEGQGQQRNKNGRQSGRPQQPTRPPGQRFPSESGMGY